VVEELTRPLPAKELYAALVAAGIFRDGEKFCKVTIELDADTGLVTIRTEQYGDPRLLETVPKLTRALVARDSPRTRKRAR
jgi:rRNA processing protein Krr1/Pno1